MLRAGGLPVRWHSCEDGGHEGGREAAWMDGWRPCPCGPRHITTAAVTWPGPGQCLGLGFCEHGPHAGAGSSPGWAPAAHERTRREGVSIPLNPVLP